MPGKHAWLLCAIRPCNRARTMWSAGACYRRLPPGLAPACSRINMETPQASVLPPNVGAQMRIHPKREVRAPKADRLAQRRKRVPGLG